MFHAVETSEHFACEHKMFEYKIYLDSERVRAETRSPSPATLTPRSQPDYSKLPDFHYLPSTKTLTSGRKPDDYQPRAQIKQMFQEGNLKAEDKKAIKEFSGKYIASEKLVADYIEHLTDIEMRKDKWRTDNDRKRAERKQQEYNDIDWEDQKFLSKNSGKGL